MDSNSNDVEGDYFEGVGDDEWDPSAPLDDGKSDIPAYIIPTNLPALKSPEIIVSLKGLTVHLFDRETGFSAVYPAGPGVLGSSGRSITPIGHFKTGDNIADPWWYAPRRTSPAHFGGLPFLRLTIRNSVGANTYALHGPITQNLIRGYVSHGCIRMAAKDIINLFWMVKTSSSGANTPVTIQQEIEMDAKGKVVDVGKKATLFAKDEAIPYGASVGPRGY
ncbi:MAG: L,D-transpeptidase [Kofleriaceae bacterium]|nr:L,D-transpeptidase [Kofleriaceae bacterium]